MRRALGVLATAAALLELAGCDTAPNLRLYNATGRSLALELGKGSNPPTSVRLEPGASTRIWNIYGPSFRLTFEGCERRYELPYMELNQPWPTRDGNGVPTYDPTRRYDYPVKVELAPDDTLYLLPNVAKGIAPPAALLGSQSHGYPLKPLSKTCR